MRLILDTGILGRLCHPRNPKNRPVAEWLVALLDDPSRDIAVFLPKIVDYELRRKLLHLIKKGQADQKSIDRLDQLGLLLEFVPIHSAIMRRAAELWAQSRSQGTPTADTAALDGDVILAAQAESVDATVVTNNPRHLAQFVATADWRDLN